MLNLLVVVLLFCSCTFNAVQCRRVIRAAPGSPTTGCYLVKLRDGVTHQEFETAISQVAPLASEPKVYTKVEGDVAKIFTMKLTHEAAERVKLLSNVAYVEEETYAAGAQTPARCSANSWGRDRLDQTSSTLDCRYDPIHNGEGSDIYILDSGINYNHEEFEFRAKFPGYDPTDGVSSGVDCHGHGTHVASLAAGKTSGSAPKANVYSVRVLNCNNFGPWSVIIDGLNYAVRTIKERGRPAVISMSLGGGIFQAIDDAVQNAHSMGVTVVVAAGNSLADACSHSPARSPFAITVGGTAEGDVLYSITNGGSCVDIFAPGQNVLGAGFPCNNCSRTLSGTSMATPLVSGVVAILLQRQPGMTPDQVKAKLISDSLKNVINLSRLPTDLQSSSPNRLLHITGSCGGDHVISGTQSLTIRSPNYPSNYANSIDCVWRISAEQGSVVRLSFTEISLEANHDQLSVYNGGIVHSSTLLVTHSRSVSTNREIVYRSDNNTLSVRLLTDPTIAARGFQAVARSEHREPSTSTPMTACPSPPPPPPTQPAAENCNLTKSLESFQTDLLKRMENILVEGLQYVADSIQQPCNDSDSNLNATTLPPLENLLDYGRSSDNPAISCMELLLNRPQLGSDYYWVRNSNGSSIRIYCEMEKQFETNSKGWLRVPPLRMDTVDNKCPGQLKLVNISKPACGRSNNNKGCSSAVFPTYGVSYSKVCGRVRGYQHSSPNAFFVNTLNPDDPLSIDTYYVDGVSLTYNSTYNSPRKHIWTFAAALDELERTQQFGCMCTTSSTTVFTVPSFVGNDYFCETGARSRFAYNTFYSDDPLWDGAGCGPRSTCCQRGSTFCKTLPETATSDIELRVCGNEPLTNEDTPVDIVELYVQ